MSSGVKFVGTLVLPDSFWSWVESGSDVDWIGDT